ncbi:MAG: SecD/SecF fusion protein [Candidatus Paceibacteria bacterium]|jgi:SecD/SecF fusion protein
MAENLGRKTILIFLLLVGSALSMLLPEEPFRLGLDLQGGTRLVYQIDWDQALTEGKITELEFLDKPKLLAETLSILRERVDPNGTLEASFIPQGENTFVIEIPSTANITGSDAQGTVLEAMDGLQSSLTLATADAEMLKLFPVTGGTVQIGVERMKYESRRDNVLREINRGVDGTTSSTHTAGDLVELKGEDVIRTLIENPGSMKLYIGAKPEDFPPGTDMVAERQKAIAWGAANPGASFSTYNAALATTEGPLKDLRAFPQKDIDEQGNTSEDPSRVALLWNPKAEWNFTGDNLKNVNRSQDEMGYPAVGLTLSTEKEFAFSDFTGTNKGNLMAIVLNDKIVTMANINSRLSGSFIIKGGQNGFTAAEVSEMVRVLKSGSLIMKPVLQESERVGAKLGDEYVDRGLKSALLGLGLVLVFMMVYYRKLGIYAALSLLSALVMLMGGMAFMKATLTLPGVAGIILTVGMAVDANILIYERIREEIKRGRKLPQACENGFNRAFVTIIDANLTTFITGMILWNFGSGPVRGFATTLMIGIITAVFSALVITRLLVDSSLARGNDKFSMGQLVGETSIKFLEKAKIALSVSAVLIIAGVGLFVSMPEEKTMGIDFVGGIAVTVNLEEPQKTDLVRERIAGIEGSLGKNAEVVALRASGDEATGFRTFRITYKSLVDPAVKQEAGAEATGEDDIGTALKDLLSKGPVTADMNGEGANGRLYFDEPHPSEEVVAILAGGGFGEVHVNEIEGFLGTYDFTGTTSPTSSAALLPTRIGSLFSSKVDSNGNAYQLSRPIPSVSQVGAQVVGELRDSAILAILISLFAVVMYIRARFAEYSFSFAAVAALVHDVLMTVGVLALCGSLGLINAEISLPMIAAFLTIIGYSLNDTIVVFDRIRENRPRMADKSLTEVLNISINQTLSRTLLTSITTLLAVTMLFIFNYGGGSVLEGFAFALTFGVIVGTYSSVFVAAPALVFFENMATRRAAKQAPPAGKAQ